MRVRHRLMTHPPFFYQYDSGDAKQLLFNMFFCLSTHFYFSLPTEKFLRGQGENTSCSDFHFS